MHLRLTIGQRENRAGSHDMFLGARRNDVFWGSLRDTTTTTQQEGFINTLRYQINIYKSQITAKHFTTIILGFIVQQSLHVWYGRLVESPRPGKLYLIFFSISNVV